MAPDDKSINAAYIVRQLAPDDNAALQIVQLKQKSDALEAALRSAVGMLDKCKSIFLDDGPWYPKRDFEKEFDKVLSNAKELLGDEK
jgi:predicted DNA-binding protein with PD1-like motif